MIEYQWSVKYKFYSSVLFPKTNHQSVKPVNYILLFVMYIDYLHIVYIWYMLWNPDPVYTPLTRYHYTGSHSEFRGPFRHQDRLSMYVNSRYKDKKLWDRFINLNGNPLTGNTSSLYWDGPWRPAHNGYYHFANEISNAFIFIL